MRLDSPKQKLKKNKVINNACGSLAILNTVFNLPSSSSSSSLSEGSGWSLGPELENLREFGQGMDAQSLGYAIGNSDKVRVRCSPPSFCSVRIS